ncbi:predicted protein [Nematostella vectensis]|uniref:PH domain-containing protein n=1 Tax=Nematostella vectensis TaxID=45351 RepID=A7T0Z5_NEMVE|nr:predicted protein [Nematostella vectensis]|eukprot:XP_001622467.1 predicted protein [Nematostella vectensis]
MWQKRYCSVRDGHFTLAHSPVRTSLGIAIGTCNSSRGLGAGICRSSRGYGWGLVAHLWAREEGEGKKHNFSIVSHNRTFLFQADDEADLDAWVSVISNSRTQALEKAFGDSEKNKLRLSIVKQVQRLPGNDTCADCTSKGKVRSPFPSPPPSQFASSPRKPDDYVSDKVLRYLLMRMSLRGAHSGMALNHGKTKQAHLTSPNHPKPIPPIRWASVSRPVRPTGPPSPPKPQFHDTPTRASPPPDMRTNPDTERRPPPLPPAPKRAVDLKPDFPPVPTHKRSKSDGKVPFGEDIADMGRPALEKKSSFPLGEGEKDDSKASRPELPPRPTGLKKPANTGRVSNDVGLTKNAPNKPKSTTLPRPSVTPPPPRRQDSDTTVKVYPPNKDKPLPKVQENSKVGDTPAPEIPSRNYSSQCFVRFQGEQQIESDVINRQAAQPIEGRERDYRDTFPIVTGLP